MLIIILTAGAATAQMPQPGVHLNEDQGKRPRTKEQKEYDKALDRAYQDATKKIPDAENKSDPWGNIRSTSPSSVKNKQARRGRSDRRSENDPAAH